MADKPERPRVEPRRLTAEEKRKAAELLAKYAKHGCPFCNHAKLNLAEDFIEIPVHYGRTVIGGGYVYPGFLAICENCGHMLLFHATAGGVVERLGDAE